MIIGRTFKRVGNSIMKGEGDKQRRSATQTSKHNTLIFDGKGRQIFDRGKAKETSGNVSADDSNRRKHMVFKITVQRQGRYQSPEDPKVFSMYNDLKDGNVELSKPAPINASQDMVHGTQVPLTFEANNNGSSEEVIPLGDLLNDQLLPNTTEPISSNNTSVLPPDKEPAESSNQKPANFPSQSDPNVVVEAKLNPLRIGIRLDDDKTKESETSSKQGDHVSLQDVLKDIDDTTEAAQAIPDEGKNDKEKTVVVNVNDKHINDSNTKQQNLDNDKEKLGKLRIQATSEKENKKGTEVNTAGVSITTESKGLQTDSLMKVLLSKLLGSDVTEALKEKEVKNPKAPNDNSGKQTSKSLDVASTNPTGTSVESPPGTIKGVDAAEMNNKGGGTTTTIEKPQTVVSNPQCFGGSQPLMLNSKGYKVPANIRPPDGRDCSYGMENIPNTHVPSSLPSGMVIESSPGTQQAVGTGVPPPSEMAPSLPSSPPSTGGLASTAPAGISVESPPGTIQAVGTSITEEGVSEMEGDNGKKKW